MIACRYGGSDGRPLQLVDGEDLVVVRSHRRGADHDVSRLTERSREAGGDLFPLFGFPGSGVGVYETPAGGSQPISEAIHADPEVEFAGRGLRDEYGAPVVYTENLFVKFGDDLDPNACVAALAEHDLELKRPLGYAANAYFAAAPRGSGRVVFEIAERLLERQDVDLCHPELVREIGWNKVFAQQWHLAETDVDGRRIRAHANVEAAWELSQGEGIVIAIIDDGIDVEHEEFLSPGKVVAPQSFTFPQGDSAGPADAEEMHGMACAGVACGDGNHGASGVAPKARLMPLRLASGVNSQDEADAFEWAADHGADVISCSWGPTDGKWWEPGDPAHEGFVPMPDSTRLAIEYALTKGRKGKGCVITWAAGNGNEDVGNDGYATHEGVMAVAACNDSGTRSVYSDMGEALWCCFPSNDFEPPWDRGRLPLTTGIWTTDRPGADGYNAGDPAHGDPGGNYTNSFGGTSSACPGAAGVVALMLAGNPELTPPEVKELIRETCEQIDSGDGEYDGNGHSTNYGYGRIDARAAVAAAAAAANGPS